jgi:hypothetical protein
MYWKLLNDRGWEARSKGKLTEGVEMTKVKCTHRRGYIKKPL